MSDRAKRLHLRLGEHYASVLAQRRASALVLWRFAHAAHLRVPEHTHERAHAFVLLEGTVLEIAGDDHRIVPSGTVVLYPRGARHRNVIGDRGARSLAIEFDDDYLARRWPARLDRLGSILTSASPQAFGAGKAVDRALCAEAPPAQLERTVERLVSTVLENEGPVPAWYAQLKARLEADAQANVHEVGRSIGRHPAHIMREFRRREGVPLGEYQRAIRIARACTMLRRSACPLAEVALACGFSDQSHLTRTFKRFVNMTPHAYRNA